jgi:hypothetical protein
VSSSKRLARPASSLSSNTSNIPTPTESDMLSVSSRQRQSKKDEVSEIKRALFYLFYLLYAIVAYTHKNNVKKKKPGYS